MVGLGLRSKYGKGHGERLRTERRAFASDSARALARASMEELERAEQGATKRKSMTEQGATKRKKMEEAGLGKRLEKKQEFAKPLQRATTERMKALEGLRGAEAKEISYGTEFKRKQAPTIESILESKKELGKAEAEEAGLGVSEMERDIGLRGKAEMMAGEAEAARIKTEEDRTKTVAPAKPGRKMRPGLKKALWEGESYRGGVGFFGPPKGYYDIAKTLKSGVKKSYEYAFPRTK